MREHNLVQQIRQQPKRPRTDQYKIAIARPPMRLAATLLVWLFLDGVCYSQLTTTFTRPVQSCAVAASENGVLMERNTEEGMQVKKGDVLGKLVDTSLRESRRLAQLRAESTVRIRAAVASKEMKKSHYESLKELQEKGHGNQRELDLAHLQFENAAAELEIAIEQQQEAKIELARIEAELELRVIRSPIDGIVTAIHREPGEYIAATDPVFCTVVRTELLRADFYLKAEAIELIRRNDYLTVQIGNDNASVRAKVIFRATTLDPKSGTGRVEVEIENADQRFMSGVRCELVPSNIASQNQSAKKHAIQVGAQR